MNLNIHKCIAIVATASVVGLPFAVKADSKAEVIKGIENDLTEAGKSNTFGYRQYLLDNKRN